MITLYAILEQLSSYFVVGVDDEVFDANSSRLAFLIDACQKSKSIHDLLQKAKVTHDHEAIIDHLQKVNGVRLDRAQMRHVKRKRTALEVLLILMRDCKGELA